MLLQLRARLIASPVGTLVPAVGALQAISWGERVTKAGFPAIVLTLINGGREYDHEGFDGLAQPRVQADLFHNSPADLVALADAYLTEMETVRTATVDGVTVKFHHGFLVNDQGPLVEDVGGTGSDKRVHRRVIEHEFFWEIVT